MDHYVERIFEGKDGETLMSVSSYMNMPHALGQNFNEGNVLIELYQSLDDIFAQCNKVTVPVFACTVIRENGTFVDSEERIIPINKILWASEKALFGNHYSDHNHFVQRQGKCLNEDITYLGVQYENEVKILQIQSNIDDVATLLCGGDFLDICVTEVGESLLLSWDIAFNEVGEDNAFDVNILPKFDSWDGSTEIGQIGWSQTNRTPASGTPITFQVNNANVRFGYGVDSAFDLDVTFFTMLSTGQIVYSRFIFQKTAGAGTEIWTGVVPLVAFVGTQLQIIGAKTVVQGGLNNPVPGINYDLYSVAWDSTMPSDVTSPTFPINNDYVSTGQYIARLFAWDDVGGFPAEGEVYSDITFNPQ